MCCIGHAFSRLQNLFFHGDVLRFQSDFLAVKHELDTTWASITHLVICQLIKAFDGKSKTVQLKIADDFTMIILDDPNINVYDLVQGYRADLATLGDSTRKCHAVGAVICTVCQSETHDSAECPTPPERINGR